MNSTITEIDGLEFVKGTPFRLGPDTAEKGKGKLEQKRRVFDQSSLTEFVCHPVVDSVIGISGDCRVLGNVSKLCVWGERIKEHPLQCHYQHTLQKPNQMHLTSF